MIASGIPHKARIISSTDCLEHLDTIVDWHQQEWGDEWGAEVRRLAASRHFPAMYVAILDGQPIGTCLLTLEDLPTRKDISPWLAGVYVHEDWRGAGVGSWLVKHAMQKAIEIGMPELFLFVHHAELQRFYGGLGWKFVEIGTCHGDPVFIMQWVPPTAANVV